jgi:hypothetical protein
VLSRLAGVATGSALMSGGVGAAPVWDSSPTFTSTVTVGSLDVNGNVVLERDADDILHMRRGTNAQTLRISNTWTSAVSNQHLSIGFSANTAQIFSKSTSGVVPLEIGTNHSAPIKFKTSGSNRWQITGGGDFASASAGASSFTGARNVELRRYLLIDETSTGITTGDVADGNGVGIYVKGDKLVIAYNSGGTLNYLTLDLDTADTTFAVSTTAP